jgi:hypothetical protein
MRKSAELTREEVASGLWNVNCCDQKLSGTMTAHCTACHATFTRPGGFDRHRRNGKCLNPATLLDTNKRPVFQRADRKYPCWQMAGPDDDRPAWETYE